MAKVLTRVSAGRMALTELEVMWQSKAVLEKEAEQEE